MNNTNIDKYKDIINLPHHVSTKHPHMSMEDRAAQFSPYAALTGYDAAIREKGRLTDARIEIDDEEKEILNRQLKTIMNSSDKNRNVAFTYFIPDLKKDGGKYITTTGNVKKIDEYKRVIILEDKTQIPINEIIHIELNNNK